MISGSDKELQQRLQGCAQSVDGIQLQNIYEKLENLTIFDDHREYGETIYIGELTNGLNREVNRTLK